MRHLWTMLHVWTSPGVVQILTALLYLQLLTITKFTRANITSLNKAGQVGLKKASRDFGIPYSTIGEKVRGRRPVKAGSKFLLHSEEERRIVEWLKLYAEQALPRSIDDLRKKAKEVLKLRGASTKTKDGLPGKDWVLSFRRRFPELSMRTPQVLGEERALVSHDAVKNWFSQLKQYLDNQDESLLVSADRILMQTRRGSPCHQASRGSLPQQAPNMFITWQTVQGNKRLHLAALLRQGSMWAFDRFP
ncbi:tigger transposable element-derived protein 6-like protein [Elysia marginata]|uniref:Tigger transposable element-derived protein 6-like protein n=1 Tax=Elysia marginata TaxID=1093978 RepID=A0AAV4EUS2_9GAST|nr:tigger transposable element-derived protein 6-like protein [Elysia marginata]